MDKVAATLRARNRQFAADCWKLCRGLDYQRLSDSHANLIAALDGFCYFMHSGDLTRENMSEVYDTARTALAAAKEIK